MLTLKCDGQHMTVEVAEKIATDFINTNVVQFTFCERWAGMEKTAQFTQKDKDGKSTTYNVTIDDLTGTALLPNEIVAGSLDISAFGVDPDTGLRMTSIPAKVTVEKSGFVGDGETPIPPTPDLYAQLISEFQGKVSETVQNIDDAVEKHMNENPLSPEDIGALPVGGTAEDASKFGGKAPGYYIPQRNLLINSYFVNPVNQRGATSYTGNAASIDGWSLGGGTLTFENNGVLLDGAVGSASFYQVVTGLKEGVYTFAAKVNGVVYFRSVKFEAGEIDTISGAYSFTGGYMIGDTVVNNSEHSFRVLIRANKGYSVTVEWAALYEGEYTAETLPPYVPKGFAEELAECRRYYRIYKNKEIPMEC